MNIANKHSELYLASAESSISRFNRNLCSRRSWQHLLLGELAAKQYSVYLKAQYCSGENIPLPSQRFKTRVQIQTEQLIFPFSPVSFACLRYDQHKSEKTRKGKVVVLQHLKNTTACLSWGG